MCNLTEYSQLLVDVSWCGAFLITHNCVCCTYICVGLGVGVGVGVGSIVGVNACVPVCACTCAHEGTEVELGCCQFC